MIGNYDCYKFVECYLVKCLLFKCICKLGYFGDGWKCKGNNIFSIKRKVMLFFVEIL